MYIYRLHDELCVTIIIYYFILNPVACLRLIYGQLHPFMRVARLLIIVNYVYITILIDEKN